MKSVLLIIVALILFHKASSQFGNKIFSVKVINTYWNYTEKIKDTASFGNWFSQETNANAKILFDFKRNIITVIDKDTSVFKIIGKDSSVNDGVWVYTYKYYDFGNNPRVLVLGLPPENSGRLPVLGIMRMLGIKYEFKLPE